MAQLVVRHLEDEMKARLRRRAARRGHSMEEEVREILRSALRDEAEPIPRLGSRIAARFAGRGLVGSDIVFDEDFDGDKIIRVTAHFNRPLGDTAESLFDARDAIRARLIEAGDNRFVFVSRDHPGVSDDGGAEEEAERTPTS